MLNWIHKKHMITYDFFKNTYRVKISMDNFVNQTFCYFQIYSYNILVWTLFFERIFFKLTEKCTVIRNVNIELILFFVIV